MPDGDIYYGRVSTGRQEKEGTIESQFDAIRRKFGPEGRECYGEFKDDPFEGWIWPRPGLDAALEAAAAPHVTRVIADHPDRFWRGDGWMLDYIEHQFEQLGVEVCYASYNRQRTPEGDLMHSMIAGLAKLERHNIKRRMTNGRTSKLERGAEWSSQRCYGWRYVPPTSKERDGHWEIVEAEAEVVREIFREILAGKTTRQVAALLNGRGLRSTNGGLWTGGAVARVVKNTRHSGRPARGHWENVTPKRTSDPYNKQRKCSNHERPRAEWVLLASPLAIVSVETQEAAITCLADNQQFATRNAKSFFLLRSLLRCGCELPYAPGKECGRTLRGSTSGRGIRYYRCTRTPNQDPRLDAPCPGRAVAQDIESRVWRWFDEHLTDPDALWGCVVDADAPAKDRSERLTRQLADARTRHDGLQAKLDTLLLRHLDGRVDDATYRRVEAQLVEQRESAQAEAGRLEADLTQAARLQALWQEYVDYVRTASGEPDDAAIVREISVAEQQRRIKDLVREIWVLPDGSIRIDAELRSLSGQASGRDCDPVTSITGSQNERRQRRAGLRFTVILAA